MIGHAAALATAGMPVLPLEAGGKRPHGGLVPHGLRQATTDITVLRHWWAVVPDANIGLRTGQGLVVLDADGDDGADAVAELERVHGRFPDTVRAITPRGTHYLFRTARRIACSVGRLAPGLDVRGDGGYIVAPPSRHPSGRRYQWDVAPDVGVIAPLPDWLSRLLLPPVRRSRPTSEWREVVRGVSRGRRNDACASLCGHLLARGVDAIVALELLVAWDARNNRPPLGRNEVTHVCESIARRELAKRGGRVRD
jgi:hypothetical protein